MRTIMTFSISFVFFNLHWRIQNYFGVLTLFDHKGGQNPNVITYFTFKYVTKSYETWTIKEF